MHWFIKTATMAATALLIFTILAPIVALGSRYGSRNELSHGAADHDHDQPVLLTTDATALEAASRDFGLQTQLRPTAVLYPASASDIAKLINSANQGATFPVSARGHAHSVNGQTLASTGVVVDMGRLHNKLLNSSEEYWPRVDVERKYVDVWGGELWIDLMQETLKFGLAPKTWTDYLYLTVGGTLSNAGLSGHAYRHGPQISNVYELEVVTGVAEILKCSRKENSDLFYGVLGGLGQFGIITRARIPLEPAPERVKWIKLLYSAFNTFAKDLEYLISLHDKPSSEKFSYVEGFVTYNNSANGLIAYNLEVVMNYGQASGGSVDREVEALLKKLEFIPNSETRKDVSYFEFLDRVHANELVLRAKGQWEVPHPHLNLFVPKSKMAEFDQGVFKGILMNNSNVVAPGDILIYPLNGNKWEAETSAVTPDEDVFFGVSFLWSASDDTRTLEHMKRINHRILEFCKNAELRVKEYLPYYSSMEDWQAHFGPRKWDQFNKRKLRFDPKHILGSGQHIFNPVSIIQGTGPVHKGSSQFII